MFRPQRDGDESNNDPDGDSTNLRSAMVCARAERGIGTMIARVMFSTRLESSNARWI
jgi:hypothetical protein